MRGLKRCVHRRRDRRRCVASFTDAWIETDNAIKMSGLEVSHLLQMRGLKRSRKDDILNNPSSHLLQMRGLKQKGEEKFVGAFLRVASFTDAWIETQLSRKCEERQDSRIFYRCVD